MGLLCFTVALLVTVRDAVDSNHSESTGLCQWSEIPFDVMTKNIIPFLEHYSRRRLGMVDSNCFSAVKVVLDAIISEHYRDVLEALSMDVATFKTHFRHFQPSHIHIIYLYIEFVEFFQTILLIGCK